MELENTDPGSTTIEPRDTARRISLHPHSTAPRCLSPNTCRACQGYGRPFSQEQNLPTQLPKKGQSTQSSHLLQSFSPLRKCWQLRSVLSTMGSHFSEKEICTNSCWAREFKLGHTETTKAVVDPSAKKNTSHGTARQQAKNPKLTAAEDILNAEQVLPTLISTFYNRPAIQRNSSIHQLKGHHYIHVCLSEEARA